MAAQYPLLALLAARKRRQQDAASTARRATDEASRRRQELQNSEKKLTDYQAWRLKETDLRWKKTLGQTMQVKGLDEFRASLGELEQGELVCQSEVEDAAKALEQAEHQLTETKTHLNLATRQLDKLEEHRKLWLREEEKTEDRRVENELDEFRRIKREASTEEELALEIAPYAN